MDMEIFRSIKELEEFLVDGHFVKLGEDGAHELYFSVSGRFAEVIYAKDEEDQIAIKVIFFSEITKWEVQ